VITAFASEVHTLLKQYAGAFKESLFWQNMLSRLHTVTDITPPTMLRSPARHLHTARIVITCSLIQRTIPLAY
jgi:hypothetical protein